MAVSVLLTGFGPFAGAPFNPTTALPARLAALRRPALAEVKRIAHVFRTSYAAVDRDLPALIARTRPDVVLLFGVATRTKYLRIETRARNARSVLFSDVDGHCPDKSAIANGAPAALLSGAPHPVLLAALRAKGLPARLSHSAGRYLCNFVYWRALAAAHGGSAPLVQFIHVPSVRRAPMRPAAGRRLTPADLLRAGEAILRTLVAAARKRKQRARAAVSMEVERPARRAARQAVAAGGR
jgi:pyroglutamyl-peptidase